VRARLTRLALDSRDGALARRLLDSARSGQRRSDEVALLSRIATSSSMLPRIAGRAVGLALSLQDPTTRRRSAHVAAGLARALDLPRSSSDPNAVRLITRDDGDTGRLEHALAALAGEGAAILIAGLDEASASEAQRYAETASIPVILLHPPKVAARASGFSFVLGAPLGADHELLTAALAQRGFVTTVRIGPGGLPCDTRAARAGEPRFSSADTKIQALDALLLLGDAACSSDAISEFGHRGPRPALALGLESAELLLKIDTPQTRLAAGAGSFPWRPGRGPGSLQRWNGAAPTWYEVLGRDAGQLVSAVLASFPLDRVDEARTVARLHARAQEQLAKVAVELWSSEKRGFAGGRLLERRLIVVDDDRMHQSTPQALKAR
jgi:hypothetical protein